MTAPTAATAWAGRTADRSPSVRRSRDRSVRQAKVLVDAARRLVAEEGDSFTINDLVKEAGVSLQTFYRYFSGKDELLLAVLEDLIQEGCDGSRARVADMHDPVDRLHGHLTSVFALLDESPESRAGARFVANEHWRLSRAMPDELALAVRPFADMVGTEIATATAAGSLRSSDPERDAWLVTQLVLSVFHQHAYRTTSDPEAARDVWRFCLAALGGRAREPGTDR